MSWLSKKFVTFRISTACPKLGYQNDVAWDLHELPNGPGDYKNWKEDIKQCQGLRQGKSILAASLDLLSPWRQSVGTCTRKWWTKVSACAAFPGQRNWETILQKGLTTGCILEFQREWHLRFDVKLNRSSPQTNHILASKWQPCSFSFYSLL